MNSSIFSDAMRNAILIVVDTQFNLTPISYRKCPLSGMPIIEITVMTEFDTWQRRSPNHHFR
jgi:hypothetical protein